MTAPDQFARERRGPASRLRSVRAALAGIRRAADPPALRVRAAILVVLLSITLVTAGCQVVGLLPLYLGVEQADIAPAATVGDLCLELRVTPQDGRAIDATAMEQTHAVVAARVGMAGIAHPSVGRDGDHLVVVLPGLEDGTEVLDGEASQLAAVLRSGPLPLPLEAVSAGPCG